MGYVMLGSSLCRLGSNITTYTYTSCTCGALCCMGMPTRFAGVRTPLDLLGGSELLARAIADFLRNFAVTAHLFCSGGAHRDRQTLWRSWKLILQPLVQTTRSLAGAKKFGFGIRQSSS